MTPDFAALSRWLAAAPVLPELRALLATAPEPCWLVGGAVRDGLLGRMPKDADFIYCPPPAGRPSLPERLAARLDAPLVRYRKHLEVERVIAGPAPWDFVRLPHPEGLTEELRRRDFAWNALALPLHKGALTAELLPGLLVDVTGGLAALAQREVRFTDPAVIADDPLRLLRAYRFASSLGFVLPGETRALIRQERTRLRQPAGERVRDELFLILAAPDAAVSLQLLGEDGVLDVRYPAIGAMRGVGQNGYHHLPVYEHTLDCIAQLEHVIAELPGLLADYGKELRELCALEFVPGRSRLALMKLALLFHDLGKPGTKGLRDDGVITFIGHDVLSGELMAPYLEDLKLSAKEQDYVQLLVRQHLRPGFLDLNAPGGPKMLHRYFVDLGEAGVDLALISIADRLAAQGPLLKPEHLERHWRIVERICRAYWRETALVVRPPELVRGSDLITELGMEPGPQIGLLLRLIAEAQVEGTVQDRAGALAFARAFVAQAPHPPE